MFAHLRTQQLNAALLLPCGKNQITSVSPLLNICKQLHHFPPPPPNWNQLTVAHGHWETRVCFSFRPQIIIYLLSIIHEFTFLLFTPRSWTCGKKRLFCVLNFKDEKTSVTADWPAEVAQVHILYVEVQILQLNQHFSKSEKELKCTQSKKVESSSLKNDSTTYAQVTSAV